MFFFKIEISSFDDETQTLFVIPEQNADENGIPFTEKIVTQTAEYKAFVKETKTSMVDCSYTQYKTDAPIAESISAEHFEQLKSENKLVEMDSNTYTITTGKNSAKGGKNLTTYLIIAGAALLIILFIAFSLGGSRQPAESVETSEVTSETSETSSAETAETEVTTEASATSEPAPEISVETSEPEFVDEPVEDTDTTEPPEEANEDGYSDSGYSSSSSSGTSGVYTISFFANGGEGSLESISAEAGQYVVLPSAETAAKSITKKGYKLIGFSDNTEIAYPLYHYKMPYEDVKLFAVWEPDTFTVTYNSNGGTGTLSQTSVKYGDEVPMPVDIAVYKDGLFLSGWAKSKDAKTALESLSMPAENLTLYAVWSEKPPTAKITLHYDDKVQIIEKEVGSTLDMLDDFGVTKDGEIVSGWYFEKSPVRVETLEITTDCDLYAKWESAEYITITIDQSYLSKSDIEYKVPLDMTGNAKITLPVVDDKDNIYNSVFGCTYGYSTKKQTGEFGTIEYFGGVESKFTKSVKLYRVLNEYGGGDGTAENPYIINYYDQLLRLSEEKANGYFIQTADIKFPKNVERKPIDTKKISRGYENKSYDFFVYDGQGYTIKNLSGNGGLFGNIAAATIKNIVIDGANISAGNYEYLGIICNEISSYSFLSSDGSEHFAAGNSKLIGCTVKNSKITADNAENVGGICGYGGNISDCFVNSLTVSGGNCVGGIVGNACSVTGSLANGINITSAKSAGGIAGTAYGVKLYDSDEDFRYSGGNIIGCGVRTFTSNAANSGGIVGTATADTNSAFVKSCYAANIYLNGTNNGGIAGADGNKKAHRIVYCLVDNANGYAVVGGDKVRSISKRMVLSVPADTGLTVDGVLSVLNAEGSGFDNWERSENINGGYPYPASISF